MRLPPLVHNRISYIGAGIAGLMFTAIVFLFIVNTLVGHGRAPYAGIVIFVVLPSVLMLGLLLIPIGMLIERRRVRLTGVRSIPRFPVVDLNVPQERNAVVIFAFGTIILLFCSIFGSYQAYEATESVAFCGATCHTVMEPEHVTYQHSPHARVRCVDCHVGAGANWYVKSKLSGLYQVYSVAFDKFPRPIVGPIESLRPAQDTCEQCHWPQMFFGSQERRRMHFLSDEHNSPWELRLLVRTGGGRTALGPTTSIHWHIDSHVDYVATDRSRQQIPWVRVTDAATGQQTVYRTSDSPIATDPPPGADVRTMDCMDCHNRPAHIYHSPSASLDDALGSGAIATTLPFIKREGMRLLANPYASVDEALASIDSGVRGFYQQTYPDPAGQRDADVRGAVTALQQIYQRNFFPAMAARWDVYPENTGHKIFRGCFRCHDGLHESADGKVISNDCTACHLITAQGPPDALDRSTQPDGLSFHHPGDVGDAWQAMACPDCHSGA